jgi:hypothetical protein
MPEDRQERLVRAAFRGIMEAVLSLEAPAPRQVAKQAKAPKTQKSKKQATAEEIPFPSVSQFENVLFGEQMPVSNMDLDMALEAVARARAIEEREATPQVQPGPGESEVAQGWAIPQP